MWQTTDRAWGGAPGKDAPSEAALPGQTHLLRVALPDGTPSRAELQRRFEAAYHHRFRVTLPTI